MAERVVAPGGGAWVVRRRWLPGRSTSTLGERFRHRTRGLRHRARAAGDGLDGAGGCGELLGEGVAAIAFVVVLVLVLVFVVLPLLVALAEIAILLLVALAIFLARVLLRRPWVVEAVRPDGEALRWDVVGWRASGDACRTIAQHVEAGLDPAGVVLP